MIKKWQMTDVKLWMIASAITTLALFGTGFLFGAGFVVATAIFGG